LIQSKYISDILDLLTGSDNDGIILRKQISFLYDESYTYTGSGLFITFSHSDTIKNYKLTSKTSVLDGVNIESTELSNSAYAILFLKNGIIDSLEIASNDGLYPNKELANYVLRQTWFDK